MFGFNTEVEENLRSEARARGVSDEAVAFTPVLPKETHLRYVLRHRFEQRCI